VLKPPRAKGGRPKGSRKAKPKQVDGQETKIIALADQGASSEKIAADIGVSGRNVRRVIETERVRREAKAEPDVDRADLSLTAQEKFDAAIRQYKKKLDLEFIPRVTEEVRRRIDEMMLPHWREQIAEAKTLYERRRGLMDKDTFNTIRRALHPDSRNSISDKKLAEAFDRFMKLEKYLLDEKDSPTPFQGVPNSLAEWDKMRTKKAPKGSPTGLRPRT
jgi:hypothetical protein